MHPPPGRRRTRALPAPARAPPPPDTPCPAAPAQSSPRGIPCVSDSPPYTGRAHHAASVGSISGTGAVARGQHRAHRRVQLVVHARRISGRGDYSPKEPIAPGLPDAARLVRTNRGRQAA
jgi:hypothetical protein